MWLESNFFWIAIVRFLDTLGGFSLVHCAVFVSILRFIVIYGYSILSLHSTFILPQSHFSPLHSAISTDPTGLKDLITFARIFVMSEGTFSSVQFSYIAVLLTLYFPLHFNWYILTLSPNVAEVEAHLRNVATVAGCVIPDWQFLV